MSSLPEPTARRKPFGRNARTYRELGWLGTLPLPPGQKSPPPAKFTGGGKPHPADHKVDDWCREQPGGNIALRLAEVPREFLAERDDLLPIFAGNNVDGWELIGIDVDDYGEKHGLAELRELEAELGELPDTAMSTARWASWAQHRSAIRVYLVPMGYRFMGKASDAIEIIQKRHRFMVVYPSTNPDAEGAMYEWRWGNTDSGALAEFEDGIPGIDDVAVLPETWFTYLTHGGQAETDDPISELTDLELEEWIKRRPLYGAEPCQRMKSAVARRISRIEASSSSHTELTPAHWELLSLAAEGHAGLEWALNEVNPVWWKIAQPKRDLDEMRGEIFRSLTGALSKIQPRYQMADGPDYVPDDKCAAGAGDVDAWAAKADNAEGPDDELPTQAEMEAFWSARDSLKHIYTASIARQMDPRGVLAAVLVRVVCSIPPRVTLPGFTASRASLNLHAALVGPSSGGKSSSVSVAKLAVTVSPEPEVTSLGSAEGIAKQYAYWDKTSKAMVTHTDTLLFNDTEVESVEALSKRQGSSVMSQWRKTFTGEQLGFGYGAFEHRILVRPHTYRFGQVLGIQTGLAGWLFDQFQMAAGTPQRILWAPVIYPQMPRPEDLPEAPDEPITLPEWPKPGHDDGTKLKWDVKDVSQEPKESLLKQHELGVPTSVEMTIREARHKTHMGMADPLAGHSTLTRLKVAGGLMWLDGRTDKITDEDWELAGVVMRVSTATRVDVQKTLAANRSMANRQRAHVEAERDEVKEDYKRDKNVARVAEGIRRALRKKNCLRRNNINRCFRSDERQYVEPALELLERVGDIECKDIEYQGRKGTEYWLKEGR